MRAASVRQKRKRSASLGDATVRSFLYSLARMLGWFEAIARGRLPQRIVRSALHRKAGAFINRLIR